MGSFLKQHYGDCEGPLGVPCSDRQARALDAILSGLPKDELYAPGHLVVEKAMTELLAGERADVSWISAESPDRMREVVLARGMNDRHFQLNPVVTLQHAYWLPPVGRSLWRRRVRDGELTGIKAKTQYPARPASWPSSAEWPPDFAFTLVQSGLLCGKSIGFLPTKVRAPTDEEREGRPGWRQVQRVIEEWVLLEYACVYLPAQQNAVVEAVSKGLVIPEEFQQALHLTDSPLPALPPPVPFTRWAEVEQHIRRRVDEIDFDTLARRAVEHALDRARGRV
ncbi:MAG: hypothetical protein L0Z62_15420 [Gemmataceae bacterium]|nr:hypothetical protein [Gemmataceae bacterium]